MFQGDREGFIGAHYSLQEILDVFNKVEVCVYSLILII